MAKCWRTTKDAQIHDLHGYPGWDLPDHYFKEGRFYDVVLVELLAESWSKKKAFQRYTRNFNIQGT